MPSHHPSAQALADFLIGDCSPGQALLISRHLLGCARCASRIQAMGAVGAGSGEISYGESRTLRPGVELTTLQGASGIGEAVYYLKVAPGETPPLDGPLTVSEILVLEGALIIDGVTYGSGDFLSLAAPPAAPATSDPAAGVACLLTTHDADLHEPG